VATEAATGRIVTAETTPIAESDVSRREELRITDTDGTVHPFYLRSPRGVRRRLAAVLVLAGFETGKAVLDLLDERDDLFLLGMDYPFRGSKDLEGIGLLSALPALRRMGFDTVDAGALALEYLAQHPDIDRERIILLGVSFGSVFATVLGGADERARAVVLIYGGGNLSALIQNVARDRAWWLPSWLIPPLARLFFTPFEPLDHVGKIAPRYLLMINSRRDDLFTPPSATALYERAGNPKKLIWYETGHMDLFDATLIRNLTREVMGELRTAGYLHDAQPRETTRLDAQ
jgi:fermentation-respiration switch protein FrsA (DUF1100 family)